MAGTEIKIVTVGDGAIGKTLLLMSFAYGKVVDTNYIPTVFDNYNSNVNYKDELYICGLWDTAGQEEYDRIRPLSYPDTDVFLCAFSVVNPDSFENISSKWVPEVRHHCPDAPIVLVGTKIDLRNDPDVLQQLQKKELAPITKEKGVKLAEELQCADYRECSAMTQEGLKEVFYAAIDAVMKIRRAKEKEDEKKGGGKDKKCLMM
ncbi:hypothetical protein FDP41_007165 [Naegleria fowleri]|uniref:Uncharacterized protein n=1 Tax=Naegleria fowleri TaxID=5763 RepID=A0A6A5BI97_NAEFO|nr:uncharacterized protein FDP41_007165 [Naegleria fowleri]KAF0973778.1 hypothetical protein FDP41_007165 [Naegleria fowleri]CAG4718153.1 unnamed protein product [Naegleria fowleri]